MCARACPRDAQNVVELREKEKAAAMCQPPRQTGYVWPPGRQPGTPQLEGNRRIASRITCDCSPWFRFPNPTRRPPGLSRFPNRRASIPRTFDSLLSIKRLAGSTPHQPPSCCSSSRQPRTQTNTRTRASLVLSASPNSSGANDDGSRILNVAGQIAHTQHTPVSQRAAPGLWSC